MKFILFAALMGTSMLATATTATAQSSTPASTGTLSTANVGVAPIRGLDAPAFSAAASDANQYQIAAGRLAVMRAQRDDVKGYARRLIADTGTAQQTLLASLNDERRRITRPAGTLSTERAAMLKLLRKAPRSAFDNLYLTQSAQVQQSAWATYKGYAEDGTDQPLKQVAGNGIPMIEQQLQQGNALLPSALAGN